MFPISKQRYFPLGGPAFYRQRVKSGHDAALPFMLALLNFIVDYR